MRRALGRTGKLRLIAGLAVASLALSACGSDTPPAASNTPAASPTTSAAAPSPAESSAPAESSPAATGSAAPSGSETSATAAPGGAEITGDASKIKAGLAYDIGGRGDQSFNDSAARGLDKGKEAGVVIVGELEANAGEPDSAKVDRLHQLAKDGANVVFAIGFAYATPLSEVAPEYPDVQFAIVDDAGLCDAAREGGAVPNVVCLTFAEEEGSYLVGVAAALTAKTPHVGFIGGVNVPLINKFEAGFTAGVKDTKADAKVDVKYLTEPPNFEGFTSPQLGETNGKGMYDGGAEIIYAAAGGSGAGVFKAAKAAGKLGIGVDSDQFNLPSLADVKDVIITSMIKNVDVAVFDTLAAAANGSPLKGHKIYDLESGGVGYSTSGGKIDGITAQIDEAKAKIIAGEITVPTTVG